MRSVRVTGAALTARNMALDVSDSCFVTGGDAGDAVWVHNCPPIWSKGKQGNPVQNAFDHYKKHGNEFPEYKNAKQYVEGAKDFVTNPPPGTLTKTRPNGDKLFYNSVHEHLRRDKLCWRTKNDV